MAKTREPKSKPHDNSTNGGPQPALTFEEERELFLGHRRTVLEIQARFAVVKKELDDAFKLARQEGKFTKQDFAIASDLAGNRRSEAKVAGEVKRRLKIARFIGHKLGAQFDLFADADERAPTVDEAFDRGKQASMEGEPRKPPYAAPSPEYDGWLAGYDEHQSVLAGRVGRGKAETFRENIASGDALIRETAARLGGELPPAAQEEPGL